MKTEQEKVSYIIGKQIFASFQEQGLDIDIDTVCLSIKEASEGKEERISNEEAQEIMGNFQQKRQAELQAEAAKMAEANIKEGQDFLADNGKQDDVITTESGLQYRVLKEGEGDKALATDTVETHYEGRLINGEVFDSSYQRGTPATFPVNGVIQGWQEALQLMNPGTKLELFVPSNLAYGERGSAPVIGPNSTLIFEVELLNIK